MREKKCPPVQVLQLVSWPLAMLIEIYEWTTACSFEHRRKTAYVALRKVDGVGFKVTLTLSEGAQLAASVESSK